MCLKLRTLFFYSCACRTLEPSTHIIRIDPKPHLIFGRGSAPIAGKLLRLLYRVKHPSPRFLVANDVLGGMICTTKHYVHCEAPQESEMAVRMMGVVHAMRDGTASRIG